MAKRGARTGVQNGKGNPWIPYSFVMPRAGIFWESVSGIENQERLKEARTVSHLDGLPNYIVAKETVVKPWFETDKKWAQFGLSRDGCKGAIASACRRPCRRQSTHLFV